MVNDFCKQLTETVQRLGIAQKPHNICNVDETGFQTDIGNQKLLCRRESTQNCSNIHKNHVHCSAVGTFLSPYVVYKGLHLYDTWCQGGPENAKYNGSLNSAKNPPIHLGGWIVSSLWNGSRKSLRRQKILTGQNC